MSDEHKSAGGVARQGGRFARLWASQETLIAVLAIAMIAAHLYLRFGLHSGVTASNVPLWVAMILGGGPLVWGLIREVSKGRFGADLLAGISIVVSALLGEYLAGTLVVLMLSGGEALEAYAVRSASSVLRALSARMPTLAHRKTDAGLEDVALSDIAVDDVVSIFPHEICPVDGVVIEGHGVMDESFLTGEPYQMSKTPGSTVLSGAINGEAALLIRASKLAVDSRYAKIMRVMEESEQRRPQIRRLADSLGAWFTPVAVLIGLGAWIATQDPIRFLAVMVVATPCPLLIAIPVTLIGSISLAARRAIIIRDPAALESADSCRTLIFDKTGTLTYGKPKLIDQLVVEGQPVAEVLALASSLEQFSKHPLAHAVLEAAAAAGSEIHNVSEISEPPGQGLTGTVAGRVVEVTSRKKLLREHPEAVDLLPEEASGLECVVVIDGKYAATYRFRDMPRPDGASFIKHLGPRHQVGRTLLVTGDRESEASYLAEQVGIANVYASQSPEQKLAIVDEETALAPTIYVGDGINDAPALMAATIGIAMGQNSDVTTEAADVVILDSSLRKIDEFLHIGKRMRRIALQSAVGGMLLSVVAMVFAAAGYLSPVAGAICQEVIDVLAVLNALRVAIPPGSLIDF